MHEKFKNIIKFSPLLTTTQAFYDTWAHNRAREKRNVPPAGLTSYKLL